MKTALKGVDEEREAIKSKKEVQQKKPIMEEIKDDVDRQRAEHKKLVEECFLEQAPLYTMVDFRLGHLVVSNEPHNPQAMKQDFKDMLTFNAWQLQRQANWHEDWMFEYMAQAKLSYPEFFKTVTPDAYRKLEWAGELPEVTDFPSLVSGHRFDRIPFNEDLGIYKAQEAGLKRVINITHHNIQPIKGWKRLESGDIIIVSEDNAHTLRDYITHRVCMRQEAMKILREGGDMPKELEYLSHERNPLIPNDELWSIQKQVISALACLHFHSVRHRDVKPENILYDPEKGIAKLTGFSCVRQKEKNSCSDRFTNAELEGLNLRETSWSEIGGAGTVGYMPVKALDEVEREKKIKKRRPKEIDIEAEVERFRIEKDIKIEIKE